jgi:hypothetical protein
MKVRDIVWFGTTDQLSDPLETSVAAAWVYLASVGAIPLMVAVMFTLPDGDLGIACAAVAGIGTWFPWTLVLDLRDERGARVWGWFGLKAQLWLQCGGAARQAVRLIRAFSET